MRRVVTKRNRAGALRWKKIWLVGTPGHGVIIVTKIFGESLRVK